MPPRICVVLGYQGVRGLVYAVTITPAKILEDRIFEQPLRDALDRELAEREHRIRSQGQLVDWDDGERHRRAALNDCSQIKERCKCSRAGG